MRRWWIVAGEPCVFSDFGSQQEPILSSLVHSPGPPGWAARCGAGSRTGLRAKGQLLLSWPQWLGQLGLLGHVALLSCSAVNLLTLTNLAVEKSIQVLFLSLCSIFWGVEGETRSGMAVSVRTASTWWVKLRCVIEKRGVLININCRSLGKMYSHPPLVLLCVIASPLCQLLHVLLSSLHLRIFHIVFLLCIPSFSKWSDGHFLNKVLMPCWYGHGIIPVYGPQWNWNQALQSHLQC